MQKLDQQRDIHTDFYRRNEGVLVSVTWLHDYAHDIGIEIEADMNRGIVTAAKFMFEKYPKGKCLLVTNLAKTLIGMSVIADVEDGILARFAGKCGCENVMALLLFGLGGIVFIDYLNKVKEGRMTAREFEQQVPIVRKDTCIAFNSGIPLAK